MLDRRALYATSFVRAVTTSLVGVLLGVYLARLNVTGAGFGGVVSSGLAGAALAAIVATLAGDRLGRRRVLLALTVLSMAGTIAFALSSTPLALAAAAFVGMVNGMGKDRGAALILEQAALPSTTTATNRTEVIAWYTMLQDLGHAAGAALAALPALLATTTGLHGVAPHRAMLLGCAGAGLFSLAFYARLGGVVDAPRSRDRAPLTANSRTILTKISALFAIDSLAGGFLTTAMLSYFFFERFGASEGVIGALFFGDPGASSYTHRRADEARLSRVRWGVAAAAERRVVR